MFWFCTSNSPEVGRSIAAIIFNSVVLPEPEGPINARNSPAPMSIDTSSSALTSNASRLKILLTLRASTTLVAVATLFAATVLMIAP